jgi:hypothetical protein
MTKQKSKQKLRSEGKTKSPSHLTVVHEDCDVDELSIEEKIDIIDVKIDQIVKKFSRKA